MLAAGGDAVFGVDPPGEAEGAPPLAGAWGAQQLREAAAGAIAACRGAAEMAKVELAPVAAAALAAAELGVEGLLL